MLGGGASPLSLSNISRICHSLDAPPQLPYSGQEFRRGLTQGPERRTDDDEEEEEEEAGTRMTSRIFSTSSSNLSDKNKIRP